MTLEFEKLTPEVEKMAEQAARLYASRQHLRGRVEETLREARTDWDRIEQALVLAEDRADPKYYRSARPLDDSVPLDAAIDPEPPPPLATIIATDGSQIMPDRHAAFPFSLVNIGLFIYQHGEPDAPAVESRAEIFYPRDDEEDQDSDLPMSAAAVTTRRDLSEIGTLADTAWQLRDSDRPRLALLDQRLLYWPFGGVGAEVDRIIEAWSKAMLKAQDAGALLAGYIDSPGKRSVITLLQTIAGATDPAFDWSELGRRSGAADLTDARLFASVLRPGQRSKVFVDVSPVNQRFVELEPMNEVCFFYLNTSPGDAAAADYDPDLATIARIDIPIGVAQQPGAVETIHSLVWDQCRILGDYPYALARADELAVVGQQDAGEVSLMIELAMQQRGLPGSITAKQQSKNLARGGRTRHAGHGRMGT